MTLDTNALDELRNTVDDDADTIGWGDGDRAESSDDASLQNQLLSKDETDDDVDTSVPDDGQWRIEGTVALDELNGETIREVNVQGTTVSDWLRKRHTGIEKANDFEIDYELTVRVDNA